MATVVSVPEPLALRDADGKVRAWACPRCFRVSMSVHCGGPKARETEAEYSRERAQDCGVCRRCRVVMDCDRYRMECDACEAVERAAHAARWAAEAPEREQADAVRAAARAAYLDALLADLPALLARDWTDDEDLAVELMPRVLALLPATGRVDVADDGREAIPAPQIKS